MKVIAKQKNLVTLQLSVDELAIINNALNEVLNALDLPEFSTRMGAEVSEAKALLQQVNKALEADEQV